MALKKCRFCEFYGSISCGIFKATGINTPLDQVACGQYQSLKDVSQYRVRMTLDQKKNEIKVERDKIKTASKRSIEF